MPQKRTRTQTKLYPKPSDLKLYIQPADVRLTNTRGSDIELSEQDMENIAALITKVGKPLKDAWASVQPNRASIEFGLALEGGSGLLTAFLVNGKAAAHLTITMNWGADK